MRQSSQRGLRKTSAFQLGQSAAQNMLDKRLVQRKTASLFAAQDDRDDWRKNKQPAVGAPLIPLTAAGVGLGALGLGQGMASDTQADLLRKTIAEFNPQAFADISQLPPNHTVESYYSTMMSPLAQINPFGIPMSEILMRVRSNPRLMGKQPIVDVESLRNAKLFGVPYGSAIASATDAMELSSLLQRGLNKPDQMLEPGRLGRGVSGWAHYDMFSRGPLAAYIHRLKSRKRDELVPTNLGVPEGTRYPDWMGRKFEDFLLKQPETGGTNPFEITTKLLPHDEQRQLLEKFHQSLLPEEQTFRSLIENSDSGVPGKPDLIPQSAGYYDPAKKLLHVREKLLGYGAPLAGAGVGGLAGQSLYNALLPKDDPRRSQRWDLGRLAATLGGAGTGGFVAAYLRTPQGRQTLNNWLGSIQRSGGKLRDALTKLLAKKKK